MLGECLCEVEPSDLSSLFFSVFSKFSIIGVLFLKWSIRVYVKSR